MAEYALYHEKPYDMGGYLLLANATIKMAYEDYVEALKRAWSLSSPSKNSATVKMVERVMAQYIAHKQRIPLKEAYRKLYEFDGEDYTAHLNESQYQVIVLERWFQSDHFQLFSRGVDGQMFIDRAQAEVKKWMSDRKHRASGKNIVISKKMRGDL